MKTIACKDMGMDCPWTGKAETIEGLVEQSKEHTKEHHKEYWEETMKSKSDEEIKNDMMPFVKEEM